MTGVNEIPVVQGTEVEAVKPVVAMPASQPRTPPPGAPPGGEYRMVPYVGPSTWLAVIAVAVCFGVCAPLPCCCPCDTKELYVAPDGTHYTANGTIDTVYGPCNCC